MSLSSLNEDDPLRPPTNTQNLDLSKLTPDELKVYRMYGKLPTTQQILASKFKDKKYFDSGDYAMQKQGKVKSSDLLGAMTFRHPNAERVKEIYTRNSISASNAGILYNGKLGLLNERTDEDDKHQQ